MTLEAQGGKTLLTLRTRFASPESLKAADEMGFVVGWENTLERLANCL